MDGKLKHPPFRIVAATEFSHLGNCVVEEAVAAANCHRQAELHVVALGLSEGTKVRLSGVGKRLLVEEEANEIARNHVAGLVTRYQRKHRGLQLDRVAVQVAIKQPAERVVALATLLDADVIIVGTRGRSGFRHCVLGSVAEAVVQHAPCGVFVVRPRDFRGQRSAQPVVAESGLMLASAPSRFRSGVEKRNQFEES